MTKVEPKATSHAINIAFEQWGLPKRIKLDNGWPFVHPCHRDTPSMVLLWWIGLGIEVRQNDPASPQQNGMVEGLQNICYRWVNPAKYDDIGALQEALDEVAHIQRGIYKMPAKGYTTRMKLYPQLETNPRGYYGAEHFEFERVKSYLSQQVWERAIASRGIVKFMGHRIYVGYRMAHQRVCIIFDPLEELWLIKSVSGKLLKTYNHRIVNPDAIIAYAT
ncbi:MAG: hypothetical protein AAFN81_01240 [Bacteroidota bacterium]